MWWDMCPLPGNSYFPDTQRTDAVILEVLEETLRLPSPACQEGALQGLGHLCHLYRWEIERIIDDYLKRERRLYPELRQYASNARSGCVL